MKISELKRIIPYLPDDMEVSLDEHVVEASVKQQGARTGSTLIKEEWGNHDGRYNAKCTICGWQSDDIPRTVPMPTECPKCYCKGKF